MRKFSVAIIVLLLLSVEKVTCQTITLDQLIYLHNKPLADIDFYLSQKGWRLDSRPSENDSLQCVFWIYPNAEGEIINEVQLVYQEDERPKITFATHSRAAYDAAFAKIKAYHMEEQGRAVDDGIWSIYMGASYRVWLHATSSSDAEPNYYVILQPHGLLKGVKILNNGEQESIWIDPKRMRFQGNKQLSDSMSID